MDAVEMDRLLDQETLIFYPSGDPIDVEALAAGLAAIDHSFRDEARPERFLLAPDARVRDAAAAARRADPSSPFPGQVNLEARPDMVMLWPATFTPELRDLSRRVVEWLLRSYPCTVENDDGVALGGSA